MNIKQRLKGKKPLIVTSNSSEDFGTSSDIIIRLTANAKTVSLNASIHAGSWLRHLILSFSDFLNL